METKQFRCPRCDYRVDIPEDSATGARIYAGNLQHMLKHLQERTPRQNKLEPRS